MSGSSLRSCGVKAVMFVLVFALSRATFASGSGADWLQPGPNSGARLGNTWYVYGHGPSCNYNNQQLICVRKTDGSTHPGFDSGGILGGLTNDYPAAATSWSTDLKTPSGISLFSRGSDGLLWVTRTVDGVNYLAWKNLGVYTSASPSAIWYKGPSGGGMFLFYRHNTTGQIYYIWSADGYNTWSSQTLLSLTTITSAPVAMVGQRENGTYLLKLYYRVAGPATQYIYTENPLGGPWYGGGLEDNFALRGTVSPYDTKDPLLPAGIGACIIEADPTNWASFQSPAMQTMKADVMKFQMSYDGDWNNGNPTTYRCRRAEVVDAIDKGAKVIIFRTADSKTQPAQIIHFMESMVFSDGIDCIESFVSQYASVMFYIELGNEPDRVPNFSAATARDQLLNTAVNWLPTRYPYYAGSNLRWMASMPTSTPHSTNGTGAAYLKTFTDPSTTISIPGINGKRVMEVFKTLGVHMYGSDKLEWKSADNPLYVMDYCLARLPYGKEIVISEFNINDGNKLWGSRALLFLDAWNAAPKMVRGWTFFTLDSHPVWNMGTPGHPTTYFRYCVDKQVNQIAITGVTRGNPTIILCNNTGANAIAAGNPVTIREVGGTTALNTVENVIVSSATTTSIRIPVNTTGAPAWTSGGVIAKYPLPLDTNYPASTVLGGR